MAERMNAQTMNGESWPRNVGAAVACIGRLQQQLGAEQGASEYKETRQEEG